MNPIRWSHREFICWSEGICIPFIAQRLPVQRWMETWSRSVLIRMITGFRLMRQRIEWLMLGALMVSGSCSGEVEKQKQRTMPTSPPFVFVVETLSIGKGVPDTAREALRMSRKMLEEKKEEGSAVSLSARAWAAVLSRTGRPSVGLHVHGFELDDSICHPHIHNS